MSHGSSTDIKNIKVLTKYIAIITEHMAKINIVSSTSGYHVNNINARDTFGAVGHYSRI